jgi:hypothetical protein
MRSDDVQAGERMRLLPSMQLMHASGMCFSFEIFSSGILTFITLVLNSPVVHFYECDAKVAVHFLVWHYNAETKQLQHLGPSTSLFIFMFILFSL